MLEIMEKELEVGPQQECEAGLPGRRGAGGGRCICKAAVGDVKRAEPKDTSQSWRELLYL